MLYVGCHLSSSKGFAAMGKTALSIDANTYQFFTRNPRGSKAKDWDPADVAAGNALRREHGFGPIVAHAPYTINACSGEESVREFARQTLGDDLHRLEAVEDCYYNFHPGSHVGQGAETGIAQIADTLNAILWPGPPGGRPAHCRASQRHPHPGNHCHGAAGDDGGQGQRGGPYL